FAHLRSFGDHRRRGSRTAGGWQYQLRRPAGLISGGRKTCADLLLLRPAALERTQHTRPASCGTQETAGAADWGRRSGDTAVLRAPDFGWREDLSQRMRDAC